MANLDSSKKDIRRSSRRRAQNSATKTALKTYIKKVRVAAKAEPAKIDETLTVAISKLDKAAQNGTIHPNQAARRKSRIAKLANAAKKSA